MKNNIFLPLFLLTTLLAGCTLPSSASGSSLSLSEPVDGAIYQLGEMVQARSQIYSSEGAAQVDLLVNGAIVRSDSPFPALHQGNMLQPWKPDQVGTYTLQTQMTTISGAKVQSESVMIQVGIIAASTEPTFATPAPAATIMPTLTFTPTPAPPVATAFQDANCRFGPGQVYNITSFLFNGESAPIVGRNAETTWWVIQPKSDATCWIWDGTVTVSGDTSNVPVIASPPTPTVSAPLSAPVPVAPSGDLTCRSSVFLEWNPVSHPNGIDHYEWQVTGPGGTQSGNTNGTKIEFFVSCASSYSWQVRAVDGKGNVGPYSDALSFQIK